MEHKSAPLNKEFWSPGVLVMVCFMIAGAVAIIARFTGGIGYVTNLSYARPWGLWVGVDVATGVALAAGGFTTAALAHVLGKHNYEPVTRPALLTAALGYTFVVLGLLVDIGRSWAIWKPLFNWNTNSALFEVAMCVMVYLHVLYIEFLPIVAEQFKGRVNFPGILSIFNGLAELVLKIGDLILDKIMWVFIILGIVLSCMHQSSLGTLMLIAPTKLHPLWYTPILPLLFLTSAFAVGYPMVVFETTLASSSFKTDSEMNILLRINCRTDVCLSICCNLFTGYAKTDFKIILWQNICRNKIRRNIKYDKKNNFFINGSYTFDYCFLYSRSLEST